MTGPIPPEPAALPASARTSLASHQQHNTRGALFMIAAVVLLSAMDAMMKWLTAGYSIPQIVFLRSVFSLLPLGLYLAFTVRNPMALYTEHYGTHVLRSLVGLAALGCLVYAFSRMPLASVVAIAFAAPLFVTLLAVLLLGERVGIRRWTSTVVGFLGVLVIVRPGQGDFNQAAWVAVAGTALYAMVQIFLRQMARTETSAAIVFYYLMVSLVITGALMPWLWVMPDGVDWWIFAGTGIVGGLGQICMTNAFRFGEASVVAPLDYLAILFATGYGYLLWGELPDRWVWLGTAIIVGSGLYILHRESRLRLPRGLARRLMPRR